VTKEEEKEWKESINKNDGSDVDRKNKKARRRERTLRTRIIQQSIYKRWLNSPVEGAI
jgi:hypothetical protein